MALTVTGSAQLASAARVAATKAVTQSIGCCSLLGGKAGGCGADPVPYSRPVSASRTSTLHDWVDESTPNTTELLIPSPPGRTHRRAAHPDGRPRPQGG